MRKRILPLLLTLCMVLSLLPHPAAAAAQFSAAAQVDRISSAAETCGDSFRVWVTDELNLLYVEGSTTLPAYMFRISLTACSGSSGNVLNVFVRPGADGTFSLCINTAAGSKETPRIIGGKGSVVSAGECYDTMPGYRAVPVMEPGLYRLLITRADTAAQADLSQWWTGPLGGESGYVWKDAVLQVSGSSNDPRPVHFTGVTAQNTALRQACEPDTDTADSCPGAYVRYLDANMSDALYVLRDPVTEKAVPLSDTQTAYLHSAAAEITAGASDTAEKLQRIYAYVCDHFYYDYYAWKTPWHQYCNPYDNLFAQRSGGSAASAADGKVATVCQGFAALVVALARAEGIPARIVNGVHLSRSAQVWDTAGSLTDPNHWWAEAWDGQRWITIDASSGSMNLWDRDSAGSAGTWRKNGFTYTCFDPSEEAMSSAYLLLSIDGGSRSPAFLCNKNELSQLRNFLQYNDDTSSNGLRLNSAFDPEDPTTWVCDSPDDLRGDGHGRVHEILWGGRDLAGTLDLSGFATLTSVSAYSNRLSAVDLTGCGELTYATFSYNSLTSFDSSDSPALATLNLQGNPLTSARFHAAGALRAVTAEGGAFSLAYAGNLLTLYVGSDPEGMVYDGIYDATGQRLTAEREYTFAPDSAAYRVVFQDNRANRLSAPAVTADNTTSGMIRLRWAAIDGADSYAVYRASAESGPYTLWYTTAATTFTNESAGLGETYFYRVRALCSSNSALSSLLSDPVSGTRTLPCPTGLSLSVSTASGKPYLTWKTVDGAAKYEIWRATSKNGTYSRMYTTTRTSYTNTTAVPGTVYYYKVRAVPAGSLSSVLSSPRYVTCDCAQPSLSVSLSSSGKPVLSWAAVDGADKYWVYLSTDGSSFSVLDTVTNGTSYTHQGAVSGTTYYYTVRAVSLASENATSVHSNTVSVTCRSTVPKVTVTTSAASGKPYLTWNAIDGAAKYEIWRATSKNGTYTRMYTTTRTTYTNTTAVPGTVYYYKVRSMTDGGAVSDFSSPRYVTCDCARPSLSVTLNGSGKPHLTWNAVAGADKYWVYRSTDGTSFSVLATVTDGTSYTNSGAVSGTTYYYTVRAVSLASENATSVHSNIVTVTAGAP